MSGLVDNSTGLAFGEGLIFEDVLGSGGLLQGGEAPEPPVPPEPLNASTIQDRTVVAIEFSLPLNESSVPDDEDFEVTADGQPVGAIVDVQVLENTLYLAMESQFPPSAIIAASYTPGVPPLKGTNGASVEAFTDFPVSN